MKQKHPLSTLSWSEMILAAIGATAASYSERQKTLMRQSLTQKGFSSHEARRITTKESIDPSLFRKSDSARATLSRLKKQGYIATSGSLLTLTKRGKQRLQAYQRGYHCPHSTPPKKTNKKEKIIIFYDIPEKRRVAREWLRDELIGLNFKQLQQSVWEGPAPLPESFGRSLHKMNLLSYVHVFKGDKQALV